MKLYTSLFIALSSTSCSYSDRDVVASTLILEAGGEYAEGAMESVHEVVYNRSMKRNKSMSAVCLQAWQFSCWNENDVDTNIAKAQNHPRWHEAMKIVDTAEMTNYTKGADHYYAEYIDEPYWAVDMTLTNKVGKHLFFK